MEKGGKLMKLKTVAVKKLNSFSNKQGTPPNHLSSAVASEEGCSSVEVVLHPVYVGKSRRRYLVNSEVVDHPLFRELVERSRDSDQVDINNNTNNNNSNDDEHETILNNNYIVSCEVVFFQHLLWMLENADPQLDSAEDIVDFYSC